MHQLLITFFLLLFTASPLFAQDNVYPTKEHKGTFYIINGTVHTGNGQILENTSITVENGKITHIGSQIAISGNQVIDAKGKQVYPGLILPVTDLGLKEIASGARGSNDYMELGDFNPNVRSIVAYNTDSKIIGTLRANGILLAGITPQGSMISGSSSVVQLDAWNWEDAAYKTDTAIHMEMPTFIDRPNRYMAMLGATESKNVSKKALEKIDHIKSFFTQAKAYLTTSSHSEKNLKFEAVRGLFSKKQKLFIHADEVKQMLFAIDFVKNFNFDVVIVGGSESWQIAELLKKNNISVILNEQHELPTTEDDDVDQPYKTPAMLQKAGVLFALNDTHAQSRYRNLSFNAGTAAAYGLTKEQALQAITLNSARILGIDDITGSLEVGKDANIIICDGDILDMKSSNVSKAFIQGRDVSLDNKQKQLYERYLHKYNL